MQKQDIETILASQRKFFATGNTLPVSWRLEQLKKLRASMLRHEEDLYGALKKDLGKSRMESYMCEIGLTLSELTWMEKHIRRLTREKRVPTPLAQFAARSFQSPTPYGTVLIMSPWNYPVLLTLEPLIDALAAGNTVIVKPSAYAPATSAVMEMIIRETYPPELNFLLPVYSYTKISSLIDNHPFLFSLFLLHFIMCVTPLPICVTFCVHFILSNI